MPHSSPISQNHRIISLLCPSGGLQPLRHDPRTPSIATVGVPVSVLGALWLHPDSSLQLSGSPLFAFVTLRALFRLLFCTYFTTKLSFGHQIPSRLLQFPISTRQLGLLGSISTPMCFLRCSRALHLPFQPPCTHHQILRTPPLVLLVPRSPPLAFTLPLWNPTPGPVDSAIPPGSPLKVFIMSQNLLVPLQPP